jgi:hypothetical protein
MADSALSVKTFDKDTTALRLTELMLDDEFTEMPMSYRAQRVGCDVAKLNKYMADPAFLNWASRRLQELYKAKLPDLLHTIFAQALEGKGRQQKMLLDFMGVTTERQENKAPNIVIVNNIPNPDETDAKAKNTPIDITPSNDNATETEKGGVDHA